MHLPVLDYNNEFIFGFEQFHFAGQIFFCIDGRSLDMSPLLPVEFHQSHAIDVGAVCSQINQCKRLVWLQSVRQPCPWCLLLSMNLQHSSGPNTNVFLAKSGVTLVVRIKCAYIWEGENISNILLKYH